MLELVQAVRFIRRMDPGKTRPALVAVVDSRRVQTEVIAKVSEGCERKIGSLVVEAIAAMLADDLGLPTPQGYLTEFSPQFIASITDQEVQTLAMRSSPICFGSRKLPVGFRAWIAGTDIPAEMRDLAAKIFAFDLLIDNMDRRVSNSNLLTDGSQIAIYDHELAFVSNLILGWRPPWEVGSREDFRNAGRHVLFDGLRGQVVDLSSLASAWRGISDQRLVEYRSAIPEAWTNDFGICERALGHIKNIRDNIEACLTEVARVLR